MAKSPFKTDKFKREKAKWDKILKDEGFRDIEYQINGEPADYMVGPNPMDFVRAGATRIRESVAYYEAARAWRWHLRDVGAAREEYRVWDMHAEGKSFADICQELPVGRGVVQRIIRDQRDAMRQAMRNLDKPFDVS